MKTHYKNGSSPQSSSVFESANRYMEDNVNLLICICTQFFFMSTIISEKDHMRSIYIIISGDIKAITKYLDLRQCISLNKMSNYLSLFTLLPKKCIPVCAFLLAVDILQYGSCLVESVIFATFVILQRHPEIVRPCMPICNVIHMYNIFCLTQGQLYVQRNCQYQVVLVVTFILFFLL